jgi:hypothetical protein
MDGWVAGVAQGHDKLGRLVPGHSEYSARKRRIAERLAALIVEFDASPAQQQVLAVVARCLDDAERARSLVQRVRAGNAARRLLATIPPKPAPPPMSLAERAERAKAKP